MGNQNRSIQEQSHKYKLKKRIINKKTKEDMMNLRKLLFIVTISFFSFLSCSEDEKNNINEIDNILKIENEEFNLSNGTIVYIEENLNNTSPENQFIIDLTLYSQGIDISSSENNTFESNGKGQKIWFALATSKKTELNEGTFDFDGNNIQHSSYCVNWIDEKESTDENYWEDIDSGELTILNNDGVYEISFECTNIEGESISGYYKGKLQYFTLE